ncbi:MAG: hypothetical protein A2231_07845 [Candidatus Firestonebacteria bacterium RIFOXYA2_FULL_40_8]|nr:MAG: hypothetical protein A2231_07845 [Candidatus Firestonebacteria bacterium RIFOXYA2_FULL_40_8]
MKIIKTLMLVVLLTAFAAAEGKAVFSDVEGDVFVKKVKDTELTTADVDMELADGDIVITKKGGKAEIIFDESNSMITLLENTQLVLTKMERTPKQQNTFLELISGGIVNIINKVSGITKKFEVKTPTAVAAVKGTQFGAEAFEKESNFGVFEGEVVVTGIDASGESLAETSITQDNECRIVQNQRNYKQEKIKSRMQKVFGEAHRKSLANITLYTKLKQNGDLEKIKAARRLMMLAGLKEYIKKNPEWRKSMTPEQLDKVHFMLKNEKSSDNIQNFKETIKKYPFLIEKYKRIQMERFKRLEGLKERGLPKDFLEKRERMQKQNKPRPGPSKK